MISNFYSKKLAVNLLPNLMGVDFQKPIKFEKYLKLIGSFESKTVAFVVLEFEDKTNSFTAVAQAQRRAEIMAETWSC